MALIDRKAIDSTGKDVTIQTFTADDLWASIGAKADQKSFEMRTLALSDPKTYEAARSAKLLELKKSTSEAFKTTYAMYNDAGFGGSEAKRLAQGAAKVHYDIGMKALRAQFPSATDNVYQSASATPSVMMASAARRSSKSSRKKSKKSKKSKRRK